MLYHLNRIANQIYGREWISDVDRMGLRYVNNWKRRWKNKKNYFLFHRGNRKYSDSWRRSVVMEHGVYGPKWFGMEFRANFLCDAIFGNRFERVPTAFENPPLRFPLLRAVDARFHVSLLDVHWIKSHERYLTSQGPRNAGANLHNSTAQYFIRSCRFRKGVSRLGPNGQEAERHGAFHSLPSSVLSLDSKNEHHFHHHGLHCGK